MFAISAALRGLYQLLPHARRGRHARRGALMDGEREVRQHCFNNCFSRARLLRGILPIISAGHEFETFYFDADELDREHLGGWGVVGDRRRGIGLGERSGASAGIAIGADERRGIRPDSRAHFLGALFELSQWLASRVRT